VIGHETVGVNCKIARGGGITEEFEDRVSDGMIGEVRPAAVAAEGYEDGGLAGIVFGVEADDFAGVH